MMNELVDALSPGSHRGLHQGWTQTSLYLLLIHFTNHHTTSHVFEPVYIHILFRGPKQGTGVSHSQNRKKIRRGFGKNAGEWTGRVEIRKRFLAVSVAYMTIYWPAPGFKGRTPKLCVLTRWDFNFCIHSSALKGLVIAEIHY